MFTYKVTLFGSNGLNTIHSANSLLCLLKMVKNDKSWTVCQFEHFTAGHYEVMDQKDFNRFNH